MFQEYVFVGITVLIGVILATVISQAGINYLEVSSQIAEIEQLRQDTTSLGCSSLGGVVAGQAAEMNQRIASNQVWNKMFIMGIMMPDVWDDVAFIEIPNCGGDR